MLSQESMKGRKEGYVTGIESAAALVLRLPHLSAVMSGSLTMKIQE